MTTRKPYNPFEGETAHREVLEVAAALKTAGLPVNEVAGEGSCPATSPYDILLGEDRLQLQIRGSDIENFDTLHVPDESLDYDLYIARSRSGAYFMTDKKSIELAPMIEVPNRFKPRGERFYNVPISYFKTFENRDHLVRHFVYRAKI